MGLALATFRWRVYLVIGAVWLAAGMAAAQPPDEEATEVSPITVTPPPTVPTPRTNSWAPNLSVEQTAQQLCVFLNAPHQWLRDREQLARGLHDATLAAAQTRRAVGAGRATAREVEEAELARQRAFRTLFDIPYHTTAHPDFRGDRYLVVENLQYLDIESLWPAKVIEGQVRNASRRPIYMPRLGYWVADERDAILLTNATLPPVEVLGPGEVATFRVKLNNPPEHGRTAGVHFGGVYYGDPFLGCPFQGGDDFNPNQTADALTRGFSREFTQYGNSRGSEAPYSAVELARLEHVYRASAKRLAAAAERGERPRDELDCISGMSGHWRDYMALADLAMDAYWATRTADHVRREVREGLRDPPQTLAADRLRDEAVNALIAAARPQPPIEDPTWLLSDVAVEVIPPLPLDLSPAELRGAAYLTEEARAPVPAISITAVLQNRSLRTYQMPGVTLMALDRKGLILAMPTQRSRASARPGPTQLTYSMALGRPTVPTLSNAPPADLVVTFEARLAPAACPTLGSS